MDTKLLNCYCDHCANNTCTTNQLCYAEWRLINYDEVVSHLFTTETTQLQQTNNPSTAHQLVKLEKTFNCYRKNDPLLIRTICNQTASNTSHIIRRCCQTGDYCNKLDTLLPTEQEAIQEIQRIIPSGDIATQTNSPSLYEQYSDLPVTLQIVIIVIIVSLVLYTSVLINQAAGGSVNQERQGSSSSESPPSIRSHSQYDYSIKGMINTFLISVGMRRDNARRGKSSSVEAAPSVSESRLGRGHDEEGSENHDTVGCDTNSMASREPLIRNLNKITPADTMNLIHPHPHMSEETINGKRNNTLQMTLGSGVAVNRDEASSGSGQGQAYLSQRSVSHDIQLMSIIGRGYFGVVWRGEYKGQPVAVKIFNTIAEASWERETEIYQTSMLRHKNILGLVATDIRHDSQTTGFWLVTDFYPMGSLFDFLSKNTMTMWDAVRMAFSIANGLAHLHVEIFGTRAKPAIAHRDMKSKNILVKNDGTCCIADLGMAVRYNSSTGIVDVPSNTRIGTRRYLAPEILEDKLNLLDFEAVKSADVYAFGLVLWEILRRTCLVAPGQGNMQSFIEREALETATSGPGMYQDNNPAGSLAPARQLQRRATEPKPERLVCPAQAPELIQQRIDQQMLQQGDPQYYAEYQRHHQPQQAQSEQQQQGRQIQQQPEHLQPHQQPQQELPHQHHERQQDQQQQDHHHQRPERQVMRSVSHHLNDEQQQRLQCRFPIHAEQLWQQQQRQQQQQQLQQPDQQRAERQQEMLEESLESLDETTHELAYACEPFQVPYQYDVSPDPTAAEMYEAICVRKIRPRLSPRWLRFASMRDYVTLMTECWYEKPQARLSALRLRKSFGDLAAKYFNLNIMEYD